MRRVPFAHTASSHPYHKVPIRVRDNDSLMPLNFQSWELMISFLHKVSGLGHFVTVAEYGLMGSAIQIQELLRETRAGS